MHNKGNHQQNRLKRQLTEWENISANDMTDKGLIYHIYKQLIQLNIKTNNPIKKWAEEQTFFQRRNADGQKTYEKMLNITNHQGNANQRHNEISPHTCQKGYHQKEHK